MEIDIRLEQSVSYFNDYFAVSLRMELPTLSYLTVGNFFLPNIAPRHGFLAPGLIQVELSISDRSVLSIT